MTSLLLAPKRAADWLIVNHLRRLPGWPTPAMPAAASEPAPEPVMPWVPTVTRRRVFNGVLPVLSFAVADWLNSSNRSDRSLHELDPNWTGVLSLYAQHEDLTRPTR